MGKGLPKGRKMPFVPFGKKGAAKPGEKPAMKPGEKPMKKGGNPFAKGK
jgi:hypothetical protein